MADDVPDPQYEHRMRMYGHQVQMFAAHMQLVGALGHLTINSVILANSAAAGAVLAMLGVMWGQSGADAVGITVVDCVALFAAGAFSGMVSAGTAYCAQYGYGLRDLSEQDAIRERRRWTGAAVTFHVVAFIAAIAGMVCFALGVWNGLDALRASGFGLDVPG